MRCIGEKTAALADFYSPFAELISDDATNGSDGNFTMKGNNVKSKLDDKITDYRGSVGTIKTKIKRSRMILF